jgi:copper chaperone CopZ
MNRSSVNAIFAVVAVALLAVIGPWVFHELRTLPGTKPLAERSAQRVVTLEVNGMTCPACEASIRSELEDSPGVAACEVRRGQRRAYVVVNGNTPDSTLVAAVRRAGAGFWAQVVTR